MKKHNASASWGGGIDPGTLTINLFLASKMEKLGERWVKADNHIIFLNNLFDIRLISCFLLFILFWIYIF